MRIDELPEEFKKYMLVLSNNSQYLVNGKQKEAITNSVSLFVEVNNGSVINKAFIVEFKLDIQATKDYFEENRDKILNKDGTKLLTRSGEV
jgi:hypothetical protein